MLEQFLKNYRKRKAKSSVKEINVGFIIDATIEAMYRMHMVNDDVEVIDLEIPGLTKGTVKVKLYTKEVSE